jgi:hypothetical protein
MWSPLSTGEDFLWGYDGLIPGVLQSHTNLVLAFIVQYRIEIENWPLPHANLAQYTDDLSPFIIAHHLVFTMADGFRDISSFPEDLEENKADITWPVILAKLE